MPHLQVGGGGRRRCRGGPQARPDGSPAAPARARILPTKAASCQVAPGQEGDRAARDSCSAGDQVFIAAVLQRAQFKAAQGPEGPKVAHDDPEHVGPRRVHQSQRGCTVSARRAEILLGGQESCSRMRACRARWLSRDNATAALSNALRNSRQIQQDKAGQLEHAAGCLHDVARETWRDIDAGGPRPRTEVVRAEVAHHGRHYRAGRLLHSIEPEPTPPGGERP
jgi:hypothetical protein